MNRITLCTSGLIYIRRKTTFPGANLQIAKIIQNKSVLRGAAVLSIPEHVISPRSCINVVPDGLLQFPTTQRSHDTCKAGSSETRRIKLVDGRELCLRRNSGAHSTLKVQKSGREPQHHVRSQRFCAKIHEFVLQFVSRCDEPYLRSSVWRLSRINQSDDMRLLTIAWTIDDIDDVKQYHGHLSQAWERISHELYHQIATRLSLCFVPQIRIKYEDFTAMNLAQKLGDK